MSRLIGIMLSRVFMATLIHFSRRRRIGGNGRMRSDGILPERPGDPPPRWMTLGLLQCVGLGLLLTPLASPPALAEPRILLGPTEPEEEPEVVETISGLSYDQLKRLRELRQWLEERQMIRERIRLDQARGDERASRSSLFADRELFAPLGQRYAGKVPDPRPVDVRSLKLPPLPRFDRPEERDPASTAGDAMDGAGGTAMDEGQSAPLRPVTHITPPPGAGHPVQVEYPLEP